MDPSGDILVHLATSEDLGLCTWLQDRRTAPAYEGCILLVWLLYIRAWRTSIKKISMFGLTLVSEMPY